MPYQLTAKDYEFFIPGHDQICQDDILPLSFNVLPGAKGSGMVVNYINPSTKLTLYLDERENNNHLFIGGILLCSHDAIKIKHSIDQYKKNFRPEIDENSWFLKGSGECVYSDGKLQDSQEEALTRWILWAKYLDVVQEYYEFYSCSLNKCKFTGNALERYHIVYKILFTTLERLRFCDITVVTDNLDTNGAQYKGLQKAILEASGSLVAKLNLVSPIPKQDFSSIHSGCLQFVDMQIYAMSRFIFPSGNNILMDFEKYLYALSNGTIGTLDKDSVYYMSAKYQILKKIFHHLRHRIVKNLLSANYDQPLSSMSIISTQKCLNFGSNVDRAIHRFCSCYSADIEFDFEAF